MEKEQKETMYEELGKYLVDVSKLVFGGVILTNVIQVEWINTFWLLFVGSIVAFSTATLGIILITYKRKEEPK
jgi:hypothetical protein